MIIIIKTKDIILVVNEMKIELKGQYIYFDEINKVDTGSEENSKLIFNRIDEKIKEYDSRYPGIRFDIQEMIKSCKEEIDAKTR